MFGPNVQNDNELVATLVDRVLKNDCGPLSTITLLTRPYQQHASDADGIQ